jgi:L-alanine-DL-glutamate epimerase-like enolase superfamily enzyme
MTTNTRRAFLGAGGAFAAASGLAGAKPLLAHNAEVERSRAGTAPLRITKVESYIIRTPKDDTPEDKHIFMPPVGATRKAVGLWERLDHATPSRFGPYRQSVLVKITTDQGIVGWGEAHAPAAPRVHKTVISDLFAPILVGQDARNVEALWEKMYSSQRLRGYATGFYMESIAGIDLALWDILGKSVGLPVYRLLGGKYRDEVPTYRWIHGTAPRELAESARLALEKGYSIFKTNFPTYAKLESIAAASESVGKQGQVNVDSLGAYKLYEAVKIGRELDKLGNIGWWEDPLMPEDDSGYARLTDALDVAICKGEVLSNRFQMRDLCAARAADISNMDISRAGGITECKRMSVIADAYGLMWTPHVSIGSVPYMAASIHLGVATPNCLVMEDAGQAAGPFGNALLKEPLEYRPGYVKVPERPGLGIEFNETELAKILVS